MVQLLIIEKIIIALHSPTPWEVLLCHMTQQDVKVKLTPGVRRDSAVFIIMIIIIIIINSCIHVHIRSTLKFLV